MRFFLVHTFFYTRRTGSISRQSSGLAIVWTLLDTMQIPPLHRRLATLVGLFLLLLIASGFIPETPIDTGSPSDAEPALKPQSPSTNAPLLQPSAENTKLTVPTKPSANQPKQFKTTVRNGDNMAMIFANNGFSARTLHALTQTEHGKVLADIFPGAELTFESTEQLLTSLTYQPGPLESVVFTSNGEGGFTSEERFAEPEKVLIYKHGIIDNSLFLTSQSVGLPDNLTMRLAQIFQWDIDFVLDIRPGDEFFALYEEHYLDGEFIGYGDILAARFVNQSRPYTAVHYTNEGGSADYFDPKGLSMRKAFLRAPVEFSRISSSFNLRRKHPLYKTVRPHRGIDYAAPRGTPILAAGDGRVEQASRTKANGNYVVIKHGEQFVTKYLHLSKFARNIKTGKRVKQGQTIGYVGATGYATGPHLHYEFLVNGVHQNPRTVTLPQAQPVRQQEIDRFRERTFTSILQLDHFRDQAVLASAAASR